VRVPELITDDAGEPILDSNGNVQFVPLGINDFNGSLKVSGITLGLGRRVSWPDDFFTLSNSISYLIYELDNFENSLGFNTGTSNSITFNTTIARNSIDNPMFPRSGSLLSLAISLTPPYSLFSDKDYDNLTNAERYNLVEYHKWMFDAKYYLNLAGNLVMEARGHLGFIGSYTDRTGISPFERFQLGGAGLTGQNFILGTEVVGLRGYEDNTVTPPNFGLGGVIDANQIRGGVAYSKYVMELRYPLSLNPTATIYLLGFAEAGNNFGEFSQFTPFDLYRSAGFGARIFMPAFGLIGVDWAYGFDALPGRPNPSGAQFHFSIGQQIR